MPPRQHAALTRRPLSLQAEAEARAADTYERRLAELKALAPLLARLDELRPALAERGLTVYTDQVSLRIENISSSAWGDRHKVLRVMVDTMLDKTAPRRWFAALRELGLEVVSFTKSGYYDTALMRKKHLLLRVDLSDSDRQALVSQQAANDPPAVLHVTPGQVVATAQANPHATVICTTDEAGQPLPGGYAMAPAAHPATAALAA